VTRPAVSKRSLMASGIPDAGCSGQARKIHTRRSSVLALASYQHPYACTELDHEPGTGECRAGSAQRGGRRRLALWPVRSLLQSREATVSKRSRAAALA
jgi:hypothetical protein